MADEKYRKVPLSRGFFATVDAEDYERVMEAGPWYVHPASRRVHAKRSVIGAHGKPTTQWLHRFILGATDPNVLVDHINRRGLDNRKANLRIATKSQNTANSAKPAPWKASSPFKGVSWKKDRKKWVTKIKVNGRTLHLGYFTDELQAARAYDSAAREHFGAFARCNLPA